MIDERGLNGLVLGDVVARAGLAPPEARDLVERLEKEGQAVRAGDRLVAPAALERASAALVSLLAAVHRQQPLSDGLPREEARARLFAGTDPAVFETAVERLRARGAIVDRDRLALATHRVALEGDDARALADVEALYRRGGLTPPDAATVAAQTGLDGRRIEAATALLLRRKSLIKVDTLLVHGEALERLKQEVAALRSAGAEPTTIDVAAFKDRYGITRKFAIPLLEYLDRERITRRVGDARVVL
jgi:selenocysteine-specific elongation factor